MKRNLLLSILFCLLGFMQADLMAQVKQTLVLNSNSPEILQSRFDSDPNTLYTINVSGTFTFTGANNQVRGDAWGIYSVGSSVSATVWPFNSYVNANVTYPIYVLQLPYSDINTYPTDQQMNTIPNLRKNVKTRISPLKHLGFRMDGKPINPRFSGSYEAENSYTFQVQGTGKPFTFNILDSIESVTLERIIPGYSDNIGSLTITIEDKIVQFCDKPVEVRDSNGVLIGLDISVGAFIKDSTAVSGRRNVLENASDLAIFHNIGCDKSSGNPLLS
ncbi:MAG: hypothetical protein ACKO0Y_00640, partial [Bacteroidota bacterium]